MSPGIIDDVLSITDDVLGLRDDLGAALKTVKIITRTWTGTEPGDGTMSEAAATMLPTPWIVSLDNNYKMLEAGLAQQGDIMLKTVSKQSYATRADVDCTTNAKNVEKFYEVGGILYKPIQVHEDYVTWNIQLRRLTDQTRP